MRTPQWLDQRSLALHQLIAGKIRREPVLFERVNRTLVRWGATVCVNSQPYVKEWQRLADLGMEACLRVATEESEWAAALRQASPFGGILSEEERWEFFLSWARDSGATDQEIEELRQQMIAAGELLEQHDFFIK